MGLFALPQRGLVKAFGDPFKSQPFGEKVVQSERGPIQTHKFLAKPAVWGLEWALVGSSVMAVGSLPLAEMQHDGNVIVEGGHKLGVVGGTVIKTVGGVVCELTGPICDRVGRIWDAASTGHTDSGAGSPPSTTATTLGGGEGAPTTTIASAPNGVPTANAAALPGGPITLAYSGGQKTCDTYITVNLAEHEGHDAAFGRVNGVPINTDTAPFRHAGAARSDQIFPGNVGVSAVGGALNEIICH